MKKNNTHIVNKVNLEINTPNKDKAFELKNKIDSFVKDQLFPELEALFDEMSSSEQIRRFETVQLEFEMQHTEDLELLADKFVDQIRKRLSEINNQELAIISDESPEEDNNPNLLNSSIKTSDSRLSEYPGKSEISRYSNLKNTFIYFLETGQMPWYAIPELLEEFVQPAHFEEAIGDRTFVAQLKKLFENQPESLVRFVNQFNSEAIEILINALGDSKITNKVFPLKVDHPIIQPLIYELVIATLINSNPEYYHAKWEELQLALRLVSNSKSTQKQLNDNIIKLFSEIGFYKPNLANREVLKQPAELKDEGVNKKKHNESEIYIQNAGLILAHPFLKELLKRTDCLEGQDQIRKEKQDYALHLLHFLCTGNKKPIEHELMLEKFLCGMPFNQPVIRNTELSNDDKNECVDLLRSIIENWSALKNTSPDGLRQNFFLRNGKLDLRQSPVKLYVERNTIDILLEKLPWSVSVVKLPWIKDLIFIEW